MSNNSFIKAPGATLDYQWDWSSWLPTGDTISSATITVPDGLTKTNQVDTTTTITGWFAGGVAGAIYTITCAITTAQGRTDTRLITLEIRAK